MLALALLALALQRSGPSHPQRCPPEPDSDIATCAVPANDRDPACKPAPDLVPVDQQDRVQVFRCERGFDVQVLGAPKMLRSRWSERTSEHLERASVGGNGHWLLLVRALGESKFTSFASELRHVPDLTVQPLPEGAELKVLGETEAVGCGDRKPALGTSRSSPGAVHPATAGRSASHGGGPAAAFREQTAAYLGISDIDPDMPPGVACSACLRVRWALPAPEAPFTLKRLEQDQHPYYDCWQGGTCAAPHRCGAPSFAGPWQPH